MRFFRVSCRRLRPIGLLALNWRLLPLPTAPASLKKGSATVGASWFWLGVLSSKIRAFWGCYGDVRDTESDVGPSLRRVGGAASYEGTGVGVRGRAWRRRAVEARGGRFRCFWRCPHGRRLGKATPGLVRLGMQQRASSSGPFSCVANVVALRLRCRDMPSCPVFREPFLRRRGASLPERRVWRRLPSLSNLRSSGVGPATAASVHLRLAAAAPVGRGSVVVRSPSGIASDLKEDPMVLCRRSRAKTRLLKQP